jgi:hypothetical protein
MKRLMSGALLVAVLVMGACSASDDGSASDAPAATMATGAGGGADASEDGALVEAPATEAPAAADDAGGAPETTAAAAEGGGTAEGSAPPALPNLATEPGREVILTGAVDLEVADVAPTVAKAVVLVQGLGGFLVGEQSDYASETATSVLTVRVPPDQFRATLNRLSQLGRVTAQNVGSEDVTAAVVDLNSRIQSAVISVERVRLYLADAPTMADVAVLESELSRRESDLEAMRAQLRALEDRIAFATIVVTVRAEPSEADATDAPDEPAPGFSDAVDAGKRALVAAASAVALAVGAVLPWLPVLLVLALVVWLARRLARRDRRPPAPPSRPSGPPPAAETEERQPEPVG